jgi:hypothetical protein
MIIDISEQVLSGNRVNVKKQMISWLEENIGEYYGEVTEEHRGAYVGSGWEWGAKSEVVDDRYITTWFVDIADERAATMFILKFL